MNKKLICGPMATISHPAFRILVEQFAGCDEYFTEMINAGSLLNFGPFEKYYIDATPCPEKIVWQLTGNDAPRMKEAAVQLAELPGIGIDINMGCSAPDIYKTGAGIGWMLRDRAETEAMVREVRSVVPVGKRLSVKLRLGDEDFTEGGFFDFCDMLVNNGVELLTLHPRTKKEKLARPPRYKFCQQLAERYKDKVPVYLNGNVKDKASFDFAMAVCPDVAGVMISRAAVQKPWIFQKLKDSSYCKLADEPINMEELCLEYVDLIEKYQPQEFWKTRLQRFYTYFCMNFQFSHYAQSQFINAAEQGNEALRQTIKEFFEKCPEERIITISCQQYL
ncbi:tRNA-dihydrouridine synthase family protein [Treponema bryantii]|uniref:tRNA-dihydrouridine synthase family protein n=1 Tax=Treponema bryantii TaxID=163 RepID=UPI002B297ABC|nr:tRNA-dihydrouridine synthase [Treponema bryantii]